MQDLRLVGVHDDGVHLLVSGAGGAMFRLPIDEALRVAASRTPAQVAARASAAPVAMSPRDIQSRIRSGASAAEVAELSGLPLANVQRYEGPVLAEREYVAQQARKIEVASPTPGLDIYRSAFGDNPATLGEMVSHRLTAHGIDPSAVEWDSWRRTDGSWTVVARFEANPAAPTSIGEEPPAMWTFSPARKSLHNANRWAQQLSELEPLDGPVPARRLTAVSDRPFDVEADADRDEPARPAARDADGLLDMLRSRRGQRLGVDEDSDDALATLLTTGVPAAHPRPAEAVPAPHSGRGQPEREPESSDTVDAGQVKEKDGLGKEEDGVEDPGPRAPIGQEAGQDADDDGHSPAAADGAVRRRDGRPSILSRLSLAPRLEDDDSLKLHNGVSTDTREVTVIPGPLRAVTPFNAGNPARPPAANTPAPAPEHRAGLDELLGGAPRRENRNRDNSLWAPVSRDGVLRDSPSRDGAMKDGALYGTTTGTGNATDGNTTGATTDADSSVAERQPARPKRSSVPSWDEIVFGTRGD